jgi:type IV pilus assembly protein PilE
MKRSCPRRSPVAGFTLIEMMIVVVVVAILAAVALPSYQDYVTRSKIVEAKANLADMRTRMEQYFLDNRAYPGGCTAATPAPAGQISLPTESKYFTYTCPALAAGAYTIRATGKAAEGMTGFIYEIDQSNNRRTIGVPTGWAGAGSNCWGSKKTGTC